MSEESNLQQAAIDCSNAPEPGLAEAYSRIRQAILDGDFAPGTRLSQVKISESLGLSRTPVREALRLIEREGTRKRVPRAPSGDLTDIDERPG